LVNKFTPASRPLKKSVKSTLKELRWRNQRRDRHGSFTFKAGNLAPVYAFGGLPYQTPAYDETTIGPDSISIASRIIEFIYNYEADAKLISETTRGSSEKQSPLREKSEFKRRFCIEHDQVAHPTPGGKKTATSEVHIHQVSRNLSVTLESMIDRRLELNE
jgi:hypothetical protein